MELKEKPCTKCGLILPLSGFPGDRRTGDGKSSACKTCRYAAHRAWAKTPGGRNVTRRLNRAYEESNRETVRERSREKYRRNRGAYFSRTYAANVTEKGKARKSVHNAVRAGRMTKPTSCERCGQADEPHRIHAHHRDYSKRREVEWLCSVCHGMEHRI